MLKAQPLDTISVVSSFKVDLCDIVSDANPYQGKVQLFIDMGSVSPTDSLFGYDFELQYDPDKIALNAPLYFNTLTEYMDDKEISFMQDTGLALGYGLSMSIYNPVWGARKLVAMRGDYLGTCPDTTEVKINYIEFTEEFTRKINGYKDAKVISYIPFSEARYFYLVPSEFYDRIEIDSLGSAVLGISASTISEHNVYEFNVTINKPTGNFYIDSVHIMSDKVALNSKEETEETIVMNFSAFENLNDEIIFELIVQNYHNTDAEENIYIEVELLDNCSCVTNVKGTKINMKSNYAEESTSVADDVNGIRYDYNQHTEILTIESDNNVFTEVNVYSIQGQLLKTMNVNSGSLSLTTENMTNGLYVYQLITANNKVKNIFIIK